MTGAGERLLTSGYLLASSPEHNMSVSRHSKLSSSEFPKGGIKMARKKLSFETLLSTEKSFRLLYKVAEGLNQAKTLGDIMKLKDNLNKKDFNEIGSWLCGVDDRPYTFKMMWQGYSIKKTIHVFATVTPLGNDNAVIILDARMAAWFDLSGHMGIPLRAIKEAFEAQRMVHHGI